MVTGPLFAEQGAQVHRGPGQLAHCHSAQDAVGAQRAEFHIHTRDRGTQGHHRVGVVQSGHERRRELAEGLPKVDDQSDRGGRGQQPTVERPGGLGEPDMVSRGGCGRGASTGGVVRPGWVGSSRLRLTCGRGPRASPTGLRRPRRSSTRRRRRRSRWTRRSSRLSRRRPPCDSRRSRDCVARSSRGTRRGGRPSSRPRDARLRTCWQSGQVQDFRPGSGASRRAMTPIMAHLLDPGLGVLAAMVSYSWRIASAIATRYSSYDG